MAEKSKWFRPRLSGFPEIQPILVESVLTSEQAETLLQEVARKLGHVNRVCVFLTSLATMQADVRLARNLKIAINQLLAGDDRLFDSDERNILRRLDTAGLSSELRQSAQSLLNVYERYQLTQALTPLFQRCRTKV